MKNRNQNILDSFIKEYQEKYSQHEAYEEGLAGDIKKTKDLLLDEMFLPSVELNMTLNKLLRRSRYPMEIAITGQFSAGKSTFLNAILARNILPTGITPVTSKVNFINYAEEYKLKITYKSGGDEYYPLSYIANFTDQRKAQLKDIKYLSLYAPMEILKDISFVDTPGLNSQNQEDTDITKKVLKDVGGIIWLSLIDNAGKVSEAEILEEQMKNFKDKSLCLLNQKDKFTKEEVKKSTDYIEQNFSKYFAKVVPISAKLALESRMNQKNILLEDSFSEICLDFKKHLKKNSKADSLEFFEKDFQEYKEKIKTIKNKDTSRNAKLMQESNISEVLDFIENTLRPRAKEAKEFSIKKDLRGICGILIKEYENILGVYQSLEDILKSQEAEILSSFDDIYKKYSKLLYTIYDMIEAIMKQISKEIFENVKTSKGIRFQERKKTFLNKIEKIEFETLWIDFDNICKNLFYDEQSIDKMFKKVMKNFKQIELDSGEDFLGIYNNLLSQIHAWQEPFEKIKKHRKIASGGEFSNTRHFASKIYEYILSYYHESFLNNIASLREKFAYFHGTLSYSYIQSTQACIFYFEQRIEQSLELYKQDCLKFNIYYPREEEILIKLKSIFNFSKIEEFLCSKNYLERIVNISKEQYLTINKERIEFIENKKQNYIDKIDKLKNIQGNI